jgi:hypothetical protein
MRHFIYRDHEHAGSIILACDALDIEAADKEFSLRFGHKPQRSIGVEVLETVIQDGICVLPHSVGGRYLIRSAPEKKPKRVNLAPTRIPGIQLYSHVSPRQYHNTCFYCGVDMEGCKNGPNQRTKDHLKPRSRGGRLKVPCCRSCNGKKGSLKLGGVQGNRRL